MRVLFEEVDLDPYDSRAVWTLIEGPDVVLELDRGEGARVALSFPSTLLPALRRLLDRTKQAPS